MRFTTTKEARDPYADFIGRHIKGFTVIVEKCNEMFF